MGSIAEPGILLESGCHNRLGARDQIGKTNPGHIRRVDHFHAQYPSFEMSTSRQKLNINQTVLNQGNEYDILQRRLHDTFSLSIV